MRKTNSTLSKKKFNKSILIDSISTLFIFFIMFVIISNPKRFTNGTISGLKLFFYSVLPGLFPFMILTKLLTEIGMLYKITNKLNKFSYKVFGTPGVSMYAFLMSILSGYPIGAKIISDLYNKNLITNSDAKKMSLLCTTSGPIFIIGAVGTGMFKNFKIGIILYVSHIISSIVMAIAYNLFVKNNTLDARFIKPTIFKKNNNIISTTVIETINSLFIVGAYITIFYLLSEILDNFKILDSISMLIFKAVNNFNIDYNTIKGFIYGIIEVTRGAKELSMVISPLSVSVACGVISFSGLSIIMQSMNYLKFCKIKARDFVFSKCVHCVLSIIICYLIFLVI